MGDQIPTDNEQYKCICPLFKASSIAPAQEINVDTVDYTCVLIE